MITITSANASILNFNNYHHQCNIWALRLLLSLRGDTVEIRWEKLLEDNLPDMDMELIHLELGEIKDKVASRKQEIEASGNAELAVTDEQWRTHMSGLVKSAWQERLCFYETNEAEIIDNQIYNNIEMLSEFIGLNSTEKKVLFFVSLMFNFTPLKKYLSEFNFSSSSVAPFEQEELAINTIAKMLKIDANEVSEAISKTGKLYQICGLEFSDDFILEKGMDTIFDVGFIINRVLTKPYKNKEALIAQILQPTPAPKLTISDFAHMTKHVSVLQRFLAGALLKQVKGVNILIHGKPGTGKTELASSLASHLEAQIFSVPCTTRWGYQMDRKERFSAYTLCQKVASSHEKCLILFDEVEDVFVQDYSEASGKAWVNSILESNPVPAIWLSNDIDNIDPAYLRRFDYVLEMSEVTHEVRQTIVRRYFDGISVDSAWINKLSKQDSISPAQIEKAARVVRLAQLDGDVLGSEDLAETVLECSANVLGGKFSISRKLTTTGYDLSYLNTSVDVIPMIDGLKVYPKATFCFHGAPGTGKTALAKHMAEQLGMKLTVKRASDLASKFIGESEKKIAKMFREAADGNSILLLDEADSFLTDRRGVSHSWEISVVNEMLTWMEDFDGIFICTTNLLEKLDQAALRRFAFKVKFDYLKPEQKRNLFKQELMRLNPQCNNVDEAMLRRVETLQSLAPGDFAVVSRQRAVIVEAPTASDMFVALQAESLAKGAVSEKIGFLH